MGQDNYESFSHLNSELILNLMKCMAICKSCTHKCIEEGNKEAVKFECAESGFSNQVLDLCAQVCDKCAAACLRVDAQHCEECADMCLVCRDSCLNVYTP